MKISEETEQQDTERLTEVDGSIRELSDMPTAVSMTSTVEEARAGGPTLALSQIDCGSRRVASNTREEAKAVN